jgi:hypothetical protein
VSCETNTEKLTIVEENIKQHNHVVVESIISNSSSNNRLENLQIENMHTNNPIH